jgi:hypothetical protein
MKRVKRFIMAAKEALVRELSVGFGFIQSGQAFGVLLTSLGRMTAEELAQNVEKIAELTNTERDFVRAQCAAFCEGEKLNVVITREYTRSKKEEMTDLTQLQRKWSGHALYAKCMESTKEVHKKITASTKRGTAKASVKKRMKVVKGSDESPGDRAKKRQKIPFQVVGVNGIAILTQEEKQAGEDLQLSRIRSILDGHPDLCSQIEAAIKNNKGGLPYSSLLSHC